MGVAWYWLNRRRFVYFSKEKSDEPNSRLDNRDVWSAVDIKSELL